MSIKDMPIKITVAGAAGKMGGRIAALTIEHPGLALHGAFESRDHKSIGTDIGPLVGAGETGVLIKDNVAEAAAGADVIVDFTAPVATLSNMKYASENKTPIVIGTTGFSKEELSEAHALASAMPSVMASNMSLGINLLIKILADVARALGDDYDVEVVEAHHRHKKDAPSGTALVLARVVADALGRDLEQDAVYSRHGIIGERSKKEIGIQTIRAGDIVGEHTVLFGGLGERIEITHKASSRDTFARGALKAALWIAKQPAGLYDMQDVLGLRGN